MVSNPSDAARLRVLARPAANQSVDFLVKLPLRDSAGLDQLIHLQSAKGSSIYHKFLSVKQFRAAYGPTVATIASAEKSLRASGFTITSVDSQLIHVRGTSTAVEKAFATRLAITRDETGRISTTAMAPLATPNALTSLGAVIVGLAPTMKPKPMFARSANFKVRPDNRYSPTGGYWFDDLKQAYQYPSYAVANGKGVTVATVGDSDFSSDDATAYFNHEKLGGSGALAPAPKLSHVLLPGASAFDPTTGISDEADLDVQQVGGSAPGANVVGVAVGGPGEPFLTAYSYLDESNSADIVSTSYGECELYYTAAYNGGTDFTSTLQAYHDLFRQGNVEGITFVFSSGDDSGIGCYPAAYFGPGTGKTYNPIPGAGIWVDDPNVTGVGGTNLVTSSATGSLESKYVNENEVGDRITTAVDYFGTGNAIQGAMWGSGGGISKIFGKPSFQNLVSTGASTRTAPDVSMTMGGCPFYGPGINVECGPLNAAGTSYVRDSYDLAVIGGQLSGLIGTSASAPEFAGLLAVKESVIGSRLGNENEDIYELAKDNTSFSFAFYKQAIHSFNGVYAVGNGKTGYNTTVGNGTPIARSFVFTPFAPIAGDPQTASNP